MIRVRNKKESVEMMKKLNLNYFPLEVFNKNDEQGISNFFKRFPSEEYVLRNTDKAKGNFFYVTNFDEAKEKLNSFENDVTICVSYRPFKNKVLLVGDICIDKKDGDVLVQLTARDDKKATHRNIYEKPKYNLNCSLENDELWKIEGIENVIKYVSDHELFGCIVEFALYKVKLGINNENIVISEIRTGY